jgi:FlaA1/EpsC-like NDP-sugar epimerase
MLAIPAQLATFRRWPSAAAGRWTRLKMDIASVDRIMYACACKPAIPEPGRPACSRPTARPERKCQVSRTTLVTGGSGYIGALLVHELLDAGWEVRVLDSLLHRQEDIASEQQRAGVEVVRGDVRDAQARAKALMGAEAVVHLAAIVGDPACARDPQVSDEVNVKAT